MNATEWTLILTGVGGALTWASYIARIMWGFKSKWDETLSRLGNMDSRLTSLSEHVQHTDQRLERHLDWHDQRRPHLR